MVFEVLEPLFMATKLSCTTNIMWNWVIEALASSNQVDAAVLIELVKNTPEISEDVGKNAREVVSLRILETLVVQGCRGNNDGASMPGQKIVFDPSASCEDVLRHILHGTSASNLKIGGPEMFNWDVQSFIAHKRDCFPRSALQKLKGAILEGSHSLLASVKERSGIASGTQCDDNMPVDGGNSNDLVQRLEESSNNTEILAPNINLNSSTIEKGDDELQERSFDRLSLPVKRSRTDTTDENLGRQTNNGQITQDDRDHLAEVVKKIKQGVNVSGDDTVENLISPTHGLSINLSERNIQHTETIGHILEKEGEDGIMGHIGSPHDTNDEDAASKRLTKSSDAVQDEHLHCQPQAEVEMMGHNESPHDASDQDASSKRLAKSSEVIHDEHLHCQLPAGVGMMGHNGSPYDANNQDAATKRLAKSSDVVVYNEYLHCQQQKEVGMMGHIGSPHDANDQDAASNRLKKSNGVHDEHLHCQLQASTDDNIVGKPSREVQGQTICVDEDSAGNEGFELRTSNGTSLGVVEEWNNIKKTINSSEHNLQQNTSTGAEAKNDIECNQDLEMTTDTDECHDERSDIDSKKNAFLSSQCTYSEDSLTKLNHCVKCNKGDQLLVCSSNTCPLVVHESCLGSEATFDGSGKFYCPFCAYSRAISVYLELKKRASFARKDLETFIGSTVGNEPKFSMISRRSKKNQLRRNDHLCANNEGDLNQDLTHEVPNTLEKGNDEVIEMGQECQPRRRQGEEQMDVQAVHKSDNDISSHKELDKSDGNKRYAGIRRSKKSSQQSVSALPSEALDQQNSGSSEEENEKSAASDRSMRLRKPQKQYTYPAMPQLRRKKLPWTEVEEEKLKEGVQRFVSVHDQNIPWKQILEFGGDVFLKGRTTIDLKDKWRNICKRSLKAK